MAASVASVLLTLVVTSWRTCSAPEADAMKPQVSPLLVGIVTAVLVTAATDFGRRRGLLRRRPPEEITDWLVASAGTTKATLEQLANPRLHFRWLDAGGSISRPPGTPVGRSETAG